MSKPTRDYPFFFTWTAQDRARPVEIAGGKGAWFETGSGEQWLDMGSLVYQANLGHGHSGVMQAVAEQAGRMCLSIPGAVYPEKVELAERLLAHCPDGFSKVFFTLGGSDANENAIKIARLATGRHKLISRYRSYHGSTMGAVSLTGDWRRPPVEPGLPGVVHVSDFDCNQCPDGVRDANCKHAPLSRIPRTMELEGGSSIAAVFIESVVGANGVLIPPPGYVRAIREACDRHGALLVMDEVLCGFGRTGRFFALEHFDDVVPDMITVGKALTGGYGTLGAVLVHERVARHFEHHTLVAGLTHYAHPLGVAAALAAVKACEEEGLVARAKALEPVLKKGLFEMQQAQPQYVLGSRVVGLLSATDLRLGPDGFDKLRRALDKRRVHAHVMERIDAIILSPPLCIEEGELRRGIALIGESIAEATA